MNGSRRIRLFALGILFARAALAQEPAAAPLPSDSAAASDNPRRFLTLPIFITEPAIGEGLGLGVVYFHQEDSEDREETPKIATASTIGKSVRRAKPPPTATGVFGFYTSEETAGVGIGHAGSYFNDKLRLVGALATMEINAALYALDIPVNFSLDGEIAYGNLKRRIGDSNAFLGFSVMSINAFADFSAAPPEQTSLDLTDFSFTNTGLAGSIIHDTRDDTMMPAQGRLLDATLWRYDDAIGSDFDYWSLRLKANSFHQLGKRTVVGFRADVSTADGDLPFFAVPYVSLRGIPALRYQGKTAGVFEIEGRYDFGNRWAAIAFAGAGFTNSGDRALDTKDDIYGVGMGARFQALPAQNVWVGIDLARGPEEYAWYIQVGHPW